MLDLVQVGEVVNFRIQHFLVAPVEPDADLYGEGQDEDPTT